MSRPATPLPDASTQWTELGTWLRDGWRMAVRHFPALVLVALVADVPLAFIRPAVADRWSGLGATLLVLASIAAITPLAKAAAIVAIDRWDHRRSGALSAAFAALVRRFPMLVLASLLWLVAVFAGVALLVVPGVIALVLGQCLMGAVVLEGRSVADAVRRSVALVRPRFLAVGALFLIVQAVAGIAAGVLESILDPLVDGVALDILSGALSSPFAFAPLAVLFLRSRASDDAAAAESGPA